MLGSQTQLFFIKRFLIALLILLFFEIGYLWAQKGHSASEAFDVSVSLDSVLPIISEFIVFYMLGYLFVFFPCFVIKDPRKFHLGMFIFIVLMSVSFLIFKYFPVIMYKEYASGDSFFDKITYFQQSKDTRYNNTPSLHVSLNLFCLLVLTHYKSKWMLFSPFVMCILLSTLLVKQHLLVDLIAGIIFGMGAFYAFLSLNKTMTTAGAKRLFYVALSIVFVVLLLQRSQVIKLFEGLWGLLLKVF